MSSGLLRHIPGSLIPLVLLWALVPGCKVGPDYQRPDLNLPDSWVQARSEIQGQSPPQLENWWTVFQDPMLDDLILEAEEPLVLQTCSHLFYADCMENEFDIEAMVQRFQARAAAVKKKRSPACWR